MGGEDMSRASRGTIWFDYADAGRKRKLLPNVSAVAAAGDYLWTASDEMRTVECLERRGQGYRLYRQFKLDELFPGLPGAEKELEADVEALDVAHGRLWVSGSHSLTRRSRDKTDATVDPRIRDRPSRRLLGSVELNKDGGGVVAPGKALPYDGAGNLRTTLGSISHIAPFMDLPSKENGLDIEGLAIFRRKIYVGMRGPVVDNVALVAAIELMPDFSVDETGVFLHFVDLGGLGVRDVTRWGGGILILAGPVNGADSPFRLLQWMPRRTGKIQKPEKVLDLQPGADHPEGICALTRAGANGLIVLYDTKSDKRISGTRYRADWLKLPA
jgi:Protein of unknown function (DUF3616)